MSWVTVLADDNYEVLADAPDKAVPDPDYTIAVAAFEEGELVGRMFVVVLPHLEAPWIREDKRGGTLAKRMEEELLREAGKFGIERVFAFAVDDTIADYLSRLGYEKTEITVWEKNNAKPIQE